LYLLDLYLIDLHDVGIVYPPALAEHQELLFSGPIVIPASIEISREVWSYHEVNWPNTYSDLFSVDWSFIYVLAIHLAAECFTNILLDVQHKHIPRRRHTERKSNQQWISDEGRAALLRRQIAEGTDEFQASCLECSNILIEDNRRFINATRDKIKFLPRGSKKWWAYNAVLLRRRDKATKYSFFEIRGWLALRPFCES
jgi:hypothetical protein